MSVGAQTPVGAAAMDERQREEYGWAVHYETSGDALSLESPFYGSRQIPQHVRRERVWVRRCRVGRLMRLMGLDRSLRRGRVWCEQPNGAA